MKPSTLFWCATAMAACANVSTPSAPEAARLSEARQLMGENLDGALRITDELLADNPDLREARLLRAEGSRLLALQGGNLQVEFLLRDAVADLELALEDAVVPTAPHSWKLLADCRFDLGDFAGASVAALRAAEGYRLRGAAGRAQQAEAVLLAANADLGVFANARQRELDEGEPDARGIVVPSAEVARLATAAAERFESVRTEYPATATTQIALIYRWLNAEQAAVAELERGIRNHPDQNAIHEAYLQHMLDAGQRGALVGAYAQLVREAPGTPLLRWYQGRAQFLRGDELRQQGNFQGAIRSYEQAQATFGEYGAMVPTHAENTGQWVALCAMSIARTMVELGDFTGAREQLFAAAEASPKAAATNEDGSPVLVDTFGSHYAGVIFAIHKALSESGEDALQRTLAFNEAVLQRHPDRWGFVYNNAALAARDLGVKQKEAGDDAGAQELWERSYSYYEKATKLSPDDARIVNDCGLMLIYHLDRDFARARECFDRAIEVGQPQLDAMPATADRDERNLLEEAVGDAWQNIAYLMQQHLGKQFAEYEPFCEQAVRFYPYQRRDAARWLRDRGAVEAASAAAQQGGAAETLAKVAKQAREKAADGDFDGALTLLDSVRKECADHAPYRALCGELNLGLARQAVAQGRTGVEFFFADAIAHLSRAVELDSDPCAPRLWLAEAQYEANRPADAITTASALLLHMQSLGGGDPDQLLAAHLVRAKAAAGEYARRKNAGEDAPELLTDARTSFRLLEAKGALDAALRDSWAATEQWAGAGAEAVNVYARALAQSPDDQQLLGKLVQTATQTGQAALAVEALADRSDATSQFYLGNALYQRAALEREQQQVASALKTLERSRQAFTESMTKNPSYRQNCERWIAWCLGKMGNIALSEGDLGKAEALLLESTRLVPADVGVDLGLYETTKLGIMKLADKHYKQRDLAKVEAIYRAASDAANGDLDLLNNSGLFARDLGNALEQQGEQAAAMAMYEQSYKAYSRARQLEPTDVRLRNDCALIAIYYLERDWELSRELLDAAIADGGRTLRDAPPADSGERRQLEEAVGDCYENLALWHLKHSKDAAAAKAAAQRSMEFFPGDRRPGARAHLRAAERLLQGK